MEPPSLLSCWERPDTKASELSERLKTVNLEEATGWECGLGAYRTFTFRPPTLGRVVIAMFGLLLISNNLSALAF